MRGSSSQISRSYEPLLISNFSLDRELYAFDHDPTSSWEGGSLSMYVGVYVYRTAHAHIEKLAFVQHNHRSIDTWMDMNANVNLTLV